MWVPSGDIIMVIVNFSVDIGRSSQGENDNKSLCWQNSRLTEIWSGWLRTSKLNSKVNWGLCSTLKQFNWTWREGKVGAGLVLIQQHSGQVGTELFSRIYLSSSQSFSMLLLREHGAPTTFRWSMDHPDSWPALKTLWYLLRLTLFAKKLKPTWTVWKSEEYGIVKRPKPNNQLECWGKVRSSLNRESVKPQRQISSHQGGQSMSFFSWEHYPSILWGLLLISLQRWAISNSILER